VASHHDLPQSSSSSPRARSHPSVPPVLNQQLPVGGRLSAFVSEWIRIGADKWVIKTLQEGYRIPFSSLPPLTITPKSRAQYAHDKVRRESLNQAVLDMVEKGAIEAVQSPDPGFYSRIFLVPKPGNRWRPVIDLSALNAHIPCPSFKMETPVSVLRAVRKGQWLTSLDLSDAYFHIPIHQASRRYLRFLHQGVVWQFKALPFGLNTAPRVFTKVTAPLAAYAHVHGVNLHLYIDDWLLNPESEQESLCHTQWLIHLSTRLGWLVNRLKSDLTPSQSATYLGMKFDTRIGLAYPSDKRVDKWVSFAKEFMTRRAQPARSWQRLLGLLVSLEKLVPYGRTRIRAVQQQLSLNWKQSSDHPYAMVPIDDRTRESLGWWLHTTNILRGTPIGVQKIHAYLYTDSSSKGWGAHLVHQTASGVWEGPDKDLHINVLELKAIWLGLQAFLDTLQGSNVAIMCDNVSAIAYIRNQGGTLSRQMSDLAVQICTWAESKQMTLTPRHVPGHLNVLADHLSRKHQILKTEWSLHQAVVDRVFKFWDKPMVDLFALKLNSKLATYMSPVPEPEAWKVDSLVQSWRGLYAYAYPPTCLIRSVLSKIIADRAEVILIAPLWPHQEWFADLIKMSIAFPLELPVIPKLLKQTFSHQFHKAPDRLDLHAWRLSVDSAKLEAFHRKCPVGSLYHRDNLLYNSMNISGRYLESGVRLKELIRTLPLSLT